MKKTIIAFALALLSQATTWAQDIQTGMDSIPVPADTLAADTLPPLPWEQRLQLQLDSLIANDDLLQTTQLGLMVWDLSADSALYAHNHMQRMRPASTMKVLTSVTALDCLGANHQFTTEVRTRGQIAGHTLVGDLVCVGDMDPSFDNGDMKLLVDRVRQAGIDTICGAVVADKSMKDTLLLGEGWCWDDDNPNLSPLLVGGKDEAASRLLSALNAVGITVLGGIGQSSAPAATTLVATRTHDLADVLVPMMKRSDNWYAESLFYQIAHQQGGRGAGVKPARSYIDRLVTRAGADQKLIHVADGSGLSLYNYVTPDMEVQLLRYAAKKPEIIEKLLPSLPVAGVDGTLKSRMKGTKAQGNVQAKTGTVTGVSALAGYCTAANGHRLCFSIINMGIPKAKVGRDFQDRVCALLCR